MKKLSNKQLQFLETESIYIIREICATAKNPALLFSGGKDSVVLLALAIKAFHIPGRQLRLPFTLLHIDTGHNYEEVINFRDAIVAKTGVELIVGHVEQSIAKGTVIVADEFQSRNSAQSVTLLETIETYQFDALLGGARRDEEKSRAKERIFSFRDDFGEWNPKLQRPELWDIYNTHLNSGENMRVFPISNWTELDIWQYIAAQDLELPSLYYAHEREIVERNNFLIPITRLTPKKENEVSKTAWVRFRTIGDISCTCPVYSSATTAEAIIEETAIATISERSATRMDDRMSNAAMETRKKAGYF